ncbi:hypothetical protein DEJ48_01230 [Streptomyces venezuelae]|uniref:Uncharacterized protein n=1 Tax=Streptomyces venezuelae TaxID=54571 RepID=A0A5P2BP55_STRVZ|nr:hypothetical protein [Streptomyces venezuelae]QES32224.1 hypothetical protein DEJ48_01230 [Streptomyces venezuelae]
MERVDRRRRLSCLGVALLALILLGGSVAWLFRDELFHPFGDVRACEGSDAELPGVIVAGGATLPADASDVHYYTKGGTVEVTFTSDRVPDYLHRTGILPEDGDLFDEKYGEKGVAADEIELPEGLCGSSLRGPVRDFHPTGPGGHAVSVTVETSPIAPDLLRSPARTVITFDLP